MHRVRRDPDCGPARDRTASALRVRGDRDGVHVVGDRGRACGRGSRPRVRVARQLRRRCAVACAGALGAGSSHRVRRREHDARDRRCSRRADRDRACTAAPAAYTAMGTGVCRRQCNAVMALVACSIEEDEPTTLDLGGSLLATCSTRIRIGRSDLSPGGPRRPADLHQSGRRESHQQACRGTPRRFPICAFGPRCPPGISGTV